MKYNVNDLIFSGAYITGALSDVRVLINGGRSGLWTRAAPLAIAVFSTKRPAGPRPKQFHIRGAISFKLFNIPISSFSNSHQLLEPS